MTAPPSPVPGPLCRKSDLYTKHQSLELGACFWQVRIPAVGHASFSVLDDGLQWSGQKDWTILSSAKHQKMSNQINKAKRHSAS